MLREVPMRHVRERIVVLSFVVVLLGCGGSLSGDRGAADAGTDVWHSEPACAALDACACLASSDRCMPRSEACWCPTECYPGAPIECVCGGGRFLACEAKTVVATCATELAAVQAKCVGQAFVGDLSALCDAAANPTCVTACLTNLNDTGSCSEIDCSFCQACDCSGPATPSPFTACLRACLPPALPL